MALNLDLTVIIRDIHSQFFPGWPAIITPNSLEIHINKAAWCLNQKCRFVYPKFQVELPVEHVPDFLAPIKPDWLLFSRNTCVANMVIEINRFKETSAITIMKQMAWRRYYRNTVIECANMMHYDKYSLLRSLTLNLSSFKQPIMHIPHMLLWINKSFYSYGSIPNYM